MREMTTTKSDTIVLRDDKDWLEAGVFLIFLVIFPLAIIAIWRAPPDLAPLYISIPFSLCFLIVVPFMINRVRSARTRSFVLDSVTGALEITERRPWRRDQTRTDAADVVRLDFNTTSNDGDWYTASLVLKDGRQFAFAQGSWLPDVRERHDTLANALRRFNPDIQQVETSGQSGASI